jgi:starch synthase
MEFELDPERPVVVFAAPLFDTESGADSVLSVLPALLKQEVLVVLAGSGGSAGKALGAAKLKRLGNYRWLDTSAPSVQRRVLAAADIAIIPSRSHHSGHAVRIAQRYGAVPVAIAASGNRDAVVDCDASLGSGTGFLYDEPEQLLACLERALAACRHPNWGSLRRRVGRLDLGWERPARRYAQLFRMALTS